MFHQLQKMSLNCLLDVDSIPTHLSTRLNTERILPVKLACSQKLPNAVSAEWYNTAPKKNFKKCLTLSSGMFRKF